jgi:alpha-beta hydrolase superfamily lysophospholipase
MAIDLNGVPAIVRVPRLITKPPILLWHGFGPPASEQALMDALPLDDVPAIKVYLGLPLFGKRAPAGGVEEIVRRQKEDMPSLIFEPVVLGAALELPAIIKGLTARACMQPGDKVGLFGFSAGGAAVFSALAERAVPVSTAVTLNASTGLSASVAAYERATKQSYTWTAHAKEIAQRSDATVRAADIASGNPPPALLIVHGADDAMLGTQAARALYEALLPLYQKSGNPARLRLQIEPGIAHAWAQAPNADELRRTIGEWFNQNL